MIRATATWRPRGDAGQFVSANIGPAVLAAVTESCDLLKERMQALCPVDTGRLRDSITSSVEELPRTVRGTVGPDAEYAAYVEFGTGIRGQSSAGAGEGPYSPTWPGMPAQPYVRPAMDQSKADIVAIFGNDVGLAVRK